MCIGYLVINGCITYEWYVSNYASFVYVVSPTVATLSCLCFSGLTSLLVSTVHLLICRVTIAKQHIHLLSFIVPFCLDLVNRPNSFPLNQWDSEYIWSIALQHFGDWIWMHEIKVNLCWFTITPTAFWWNILKYV